MTKAIVDALDPGSVDPEEYDRDETQAKVVEDDGGEAGLEDDEDWKLDFEEKQGSGKQERSELRIRNAPLITDERYKGKKVSRKALKRQAEDDEDEDELDEDEKEHESAEFGHLLEAGQSDEDSDRVSSDEGDDDEEEDHEVDDERGESSDESSGDQKIFSGSKAVGEEELNKGLAIRKQLGFWDVLVEFRIQFQKVLTRVNRFPQHDSWPEVEKAAGDDPEYKKSLRLATESLSDVLDSILEMQAKIMEKSLAAGNRHKGDQDHDEDPEPPRKRLKVEEYSEILRDNRGRCVPFRNETVDKWNEKTRLTSSGNKSSFAAFDLSTLKQIEHILQDQQRLVRRTQLRRSEYKVLLQPQNPPEQQQQQDHDANNGFYDTEIFDDDDFYHQLLKELIERKTSSGADGGLSSEGTEAGAVALGQRWLQLQRLRAKAKRKVDTRASKGRKIRYDIHAKLVNFMAPVAQPSRMSDESRRELFASLFKAPFRSSQQQQQPVNSV